MLRHDCILKHRQIDSDNLSAILDQISDPYSHEIHNLWQKGSLLPICRWINIRNLRHNQCSLDTFHYGNSLYKTYTSLTLLLEQRILYFLNL